LDIINDGKNDRLHMRKSDGATGQQWKITEINPKTTGTTKAKVKRPSLTRKGGSWQVGYGAKGNGFKLFDAQENLFGGKVIRKNMKGGYKWLSASQNLTNKSYTSEGDKVTYAAKSNKSIILHPGNKAGDVAKMRFNAPSDGSFTFDITWKLVDSNGSKVGIGVYTASKAKGYTKGGKYVAVYNDTLLKSSPGKSKKKTISLKLRKGEKVFFEVDRAGTGKTDHYNDSTEVTVVVR